MREAKALIREAKDLLDVNEGPMGAFEESVTTGVEAAELLLRALQVQGDIKVVHGLGLAATWDRLEAERIVPELPKIREMLAELEANGALLERPDTLGPTREQAFQARAASDLLLKIAELTLSPTNPLADLIGRGRDPEPTF